MSMLIGLLEKYWDQLGIKHFTPAEVTMGREVPINLVTNILPTIVFADRMRESLSFPLSITSSWRSEALNAEIGGSKASLHLVFNALDLVPTTGKLVQLKLIHDYVDKHRTQEMGVGYYHGFVHIDTRGHIGRKAPATWGKKVI